MVASIEETAERYHIPKAFIGVVLLPIVVCLTPHQPGFPWPSIYREMLQNTSLQSGWHPRINTTLPLPFVLGVRLYSVYKLSWDVVPLTFSTANCLLRSATSCGRRSDVCLWSFQWMLFLPFCSVNQPLTLHFKNFEVRAFRCSPYGTPLTKC